MRQRLEKIVVKTIEGLGLKFVEIKHLNFGILRIYIDGPTSSTGVTIEDCERVTRQLQYVFAVENIDYRRLEVSSPGLDRSLKSIDDFIRFSGSKVSIFFKHPIKSCKHFKGVLLPPNGETLAIEYEEKDSLVVLSFTFADIEKACLIPHIDFGRRK